MTSFVSKYAAIILSLALTLVGWVWTAAVTFSKADATNALVQKMNRDGSELAQQCKWRIDEMEKDTIKLELRVNTAVQDIAQIKSDVRIVADWVEQQKRHENTPLSR